MKKLMAALTASAIFAASVGVTAAAQTGQKKVTAVISSSEVQLNAELYTGSYYWGSWYSNWNWNHYSPISDFIDSEGRYTIAYSDGKNVHVSHISDNGEIEDDIKFKQPMSVVGGVACDDGGNFYVACGTEDEAGTGDVCTFAVYKYDSTGALLGKAEYYPNDTYWSTRVPFDAGNCAMVFQGDLLICSYAREMYSGHQSNAVFCVDTATMTENPMYDSYVSHSFDQSVAVIDDSTVAFADHGDAHPRGFSVNVRSDTSTPMRGHNSRGTFVPFSFPGSIGDNFTNARLTEIAVLDEGIALVGSSAKSASADYESEKQQLFMQVIDVETGESLLDGSTRANGDKGILWLTDYTDGSEVRASAAAALDDSRMLVMWERWNDNSLVNSYYSIVSSDGKILVDSVPMQHAMLNGAEELKVDGDIAKWVYADGEGNDATVYRLDTSTVSSDVLKEATVELSYTEKAYTGKALKPAVTVKYEGKALKNGTDYTVSYKDNKNPGTATVTVKGKGEYSGTATATFTIVPKAVTGVKAVRMTKSKNTITWKSAAVDGYEVQIIKWVKDGYYYYQDKTVTKTVKQAKFVHNAGKKSGVVFQYNVRPFVKVDGVKLYGEWSDSVNPYYNW